MWQIKHSVTHMQKRHEMHSERADIFSCLCTQTADRASVPQTQTGFYMEIPRLKRLSTSVRTDLTALFISFHTCPVAVLSSTTPLCPLSVSSQIHTLIFKLVHRLSRTDNLLRPACPAVVALRESIFHFISRHFRNSVGMPACMMAILICTSFRK